MTDHRPEVRCLSEYAHHKESCDIECLMADEHPSCTCGLMEALAALSAPPIEPVGVRDALQAELAAAKSTTASYLAAVKSRTDELNQAEAQLAAVVWALQDANGNLRPTMDEETNACHERCEAVLADIPAAARELLDELARVKLQVAELTGDVGAKEWALANNQAHTTALRELLERHEFCASSFECGDCPECGGCQEHDADCELQAALRQVEGEK